MKRKLLHIMMGINNPDLQTGLNSVFECKHIDWLPYGVKSYKLQQDILQAFDSFKPDIVFMHLQSGDAINIELIRKMMESSIVYSWTGDVRHPMPQHYLETGKHITSTLFTNMNDVETCLANGVSANFLQVGFDSVDFNPVGDTDIKYPEIIFMGGNYPADTFPLTSLRSEMITRLKAEFGSKFAVFGGGWKELSNGNITNYKEESKAYRSCKIAINLSHFAYKRYSSDRLFRILGSGAFCLTHNFPDIEVDFKVGEELVVWNNLDELVSNIKKYLSENNERGIIAYNGCLKARTKFTWHQFANNLELIASGKYLTPLPLNEPCDVIITETVQPAIETETKTDDWVLGIGNCEKIKKYSQTGEEGYLKYILDNIGYGNKFLVDIGAWDGSHLSNTKYFTENFQYKSLLVDGDNRGNEDVKEEWITKDNICEILNKYNCPKEFSLLSYDTDGNDFDIIHAMCLEFKPDVIVCEINGTIPLGTSKKIKYNPDHTWNNDDYYGFSFDAGLKLAELIGYRVVFQNDALNIYMVRKDLLVNPDLEIPINFKHNLYHPHNTSGIWEGV